MDFIPDMDMPVDALQQGIARFLLDLGGQGSKLWVAGGLAATIVLIALALAPFAPGHACDRWRSRPWTRVVLADGVFLGLALAMLVALRLPMLSQLELNPDECGLILGARTLLEDPRFWISFENTTLGPLSTFSLTPIGLLGFPIDFTTIRVVGILIWCAVVVLIFLGVRHLYPRMWVRVLALPVIVTIACLSNWDYVAYNGEHMAVLMLSCAFWLQAPLLRDEERPQLMRAFLLGVTLALVPFAKIQPGPIALVWGVFACGHAFMRCRPRVLFLCAGAAVPAAALAVYLVVSGAWYDFWQSYVLNNLLYAAVGWNAKQQDVTFWENALGFPFYFLKIHDTRVFFTFCGSLVVGSTVAAVLSLRFRRRLFTVDVVLGLLLTWAAWVCVLMPKNNWTHYLLLMLLPAGMLVAALLVRFLEMARERRLDIRVDMQAPEGSWMIRGNVFIAVLAVFFGVFLPAGYAMMRGHPANQAAAANLEAGRIPSPLVSAILRHARPGEPVAHWGVRFEELTQAGVMMGTRDAHIERALYPSRQQQYYLDRWMNDVFARQPRVLVDTNDLKVFQQFRLPNFPEQWKRIQQRYQLAEEVDGFHIYVLKEAAALAEH